MQAAGQPRRIAQTRHQQLGVASLGITLYSVEVREHPRWSRSEMTWEREGLSRGRGGGGWQGLRKGGCGEHFEQGLRRGRLEILQGLRRGR